jgi:tetratricopeptide (TPR) repeat protein
MRKLVRAGLTLAVLLILPVVAAAQNCRVNGKVSDKDGKPWAGVTVQLKSESGRSFTLKTDKDGKYAQIGLQTGIYTFTLNEESAGLKDFTEKHQLGDGDNEVNFDFKALIAATAAAHTEETAKHTEEANKFQSMKAHVDTGVAALKEGNDLQKQVRTAPADQKASLQDQMKKDYQTAVTEFTQAEQGVNAKDTKNHAVIWADLGQAYSAAGQYPEAANAYQKAIELNPDPGTYVNLSLAQANQAAAATDPAVTTARLSDAGAACDKASALDPTTTAKCWKNVGIVLSNKGDLKNAIAPLQKATQTDPKDAQSWFLLGSAYTGTIETKQEGDKMTFVIPPGTADAYQKCIDVAPDGPYAPQAKASLDALAQMGGGQALTVGERRSTKKKK